jgi:hypothetical protein
VTAPGRPRKSDARVGRTFKFPPALIERYEVEAAKRGMNKTAFVERAIEAALGSSGRAVGPRAVPRERPAAPVVDPGVARAAAFRAAGKR